MGFYNSRWEADRLKKLLTHNQAEQELITLGLNNLIKKIYYLLNVLFSGYNIPFFLLSKQNLQQVSDYTFYK